MVRVVEHGEAVIEAVIEIAHESEQVEVERDTCMR